VGNQKPPSRQSVRRLFVVGASTFGILYISMLLALVIGQRRLIYLPGDRPRSAISVGLPRVRELRLYTVDGERLRAWFSPPATPGRPLAVFFHGTGDDIAGPADIYRRLMADGDGLLAVEYRGFPGSTGSPTEAGLFADGEAAYARALALGVPAHRIVLIGVSLGSAVAVSVAARHEIGAMVLDSPPSSAADVAAARFWMFPARWLIADPFRSDLRIARARAPLLIVHGDRDTVVPIRFGQRLYALANPPKRFIEVPGAEHMALGMVMPAVVAWIDTSVPR
jgi:fermentation-respiration switch protein FrsA (DUF1100 family)